MNQKKQSSFRSLKQITAGVHPLKDALSEGREFERVFIKKGTRGAVIEKIIEYCKESRTPFSFVPSHKLDRLTNVNHQGVVGIHALIAYEELTDIVPFVYEKGRDPLIVILDRVTDVRNLGAIVRSAECLGADCVVVPEHGSAEINAETIKASAGAIGRLPICRVDELPATLKWLQASGIQVVACTEKADHSFFDATLDGPMAIMMGSEKDGVSKDLLELIDAKLKIPMAGQVGSLNVSVALGMALFEVARQRSKS